jgi:hypothetical protein
MQFYLGTPEPSWLKRTAVPLFVSARRLRRRKDPSRLPKALGPWALDSGGFSELSLFGAWQTPAMQYASEARHWRDAIGGMRFAAPQDWMCEPVMLEKTRLSILEHQRRTVGNVRLLRQLAPDVPWIPVLQGWEINDYVRCMNLYGEAGIDLQREPLVGLGSVCRREATSEIKELVFALAGFGIRLHGFGMKIGGLHKVGHLLASADSMAWSHKARRDGHRPLCPGRCKTACNNCLHYALWWRECVLAAIPKGGQGPLPLS